MSEETCTEEKMKAAELKRRPQLLPFSDNKAVCPACGQRAGTGLITVEFHNNEELGPHLRRICKRCGYWWPEQTLNKQVSDGYVS